MHTLAELNEWELENSDQDIRDRPLMTDSGQEVGVIKDFVVDLDRERVSAVVTDQGEAYAVDGLEIRSDAVITHDGPISGGTSMAPSRRPASLEAYDVRLIRAR